FETLKILNAMQTYKEILKNTPMKRYTDAAGKEYAVLNVEVFSDSILAEFVPAEMIADDSWEEKDVVSFIVEFDDQEGETVSGWSLPNFRSFTITPDDADFDRELGVEIAFSEAVL